MFQTAKLLQNVVSKKSEALFFSFNPMLGEKNVKKKVFFSNIYYRKNSFGAF